MTLWSDFHWGERVDPDQTGGMNKFNRAVARVRFQRLVSVLIDLCFNHDATPDYPGIVLGLLGDMITGAIHDDLRETNDGPVQISLLELQEVLIWGIQTLADKFGKVFIPCVVGNHGRETLKPRAKNRVFTSYEWNLYCQLELYFRNDNDYKDRVQFFIPHETDAYFTVLGHRFLATHGDSLGVKGGDGIIGALGPIARGAIKVGNSEKQIGRDFDTLLIGHYHTYIPRSRATRVIANGCLIGYNEYARTGLRVPYSPPSQALWNVHQKYGVTVQREMLLEPERKSKPSDWVMWNDRRGK